MRVIAGSLRGLKLTAPEGHSTRPTLDRVKEAIFSMLMPYINDANILDVFAGSGAMGIEALSRGAERAIFVDCDKSAFDCIKNNIRAGRIEDKTQVYCSDYSAYLSHCKEKFDIIFLDPPYFGDVYSAALNLIHKKDLLSDDGIIVVEWDYEHGFTEDYAGFKIVKEKKYGRVGITTLKRG